LNWYTMSMKEVLEKLGSSHEGLAESEVRARLEMYGPNILAEEEKINRLKILLHQFTSPLIYILLIAAVVTTLLEEYVHGVIRPGSAECGNRVFSGV